MKRVNVIGCLNMGARGYYGSSEFGRQVIDLDLFFNSFFSVFVPLLTLYWTFLFRIASLTLHILCISYVMLISSITLILDSCGKL